MSVEITSQLLNHYLGEFGIEPAEQFVKASEGRIGLNYFAHPLTSHNRHSASHVIRIYRLNEADTLGYGKTRFIAEANSLALLNRPPCKELLENLQVPKPIALANDSTSASEHARCYLIDQTNNLLVMIYQALPGTPLRQDQLTADIASQAGMGVRKMINATVAIGRPANIPAGSLKYVRQISAEVLKREPMLTEYGSIEHIFQYISQTSRLDEIKSTPKGLVHGDLFFENTLWTKNSCLSGIIDFGDCFYGEVLHDIATGAMEFSILPEETIEIEAFNRFLMPFDDWFKQHQIDFELFMHFLLCNCVRFSSHLISFGLDEGLPLDELVDPSYNPYPKRFITFAQTSCLDALSDHFYVV